MRLKNVIKSLEHKIIRHKNSIMKTSNKLLLTAILIIIVSMVTYDFALRAEYRKGTYKSRFYGFEKTTDNQTFTALDNRVANLVSLQVERGEHFAVWINNDLKGHISITHNGNTLIIDAKDKKSPEVNPYKNSIIIICPSIEKVVTTSFLIQKPDEEDVYSGTTTIAGFNQPDMGLSINKLTHINFENNIIGQLHAVVGDSLSRQAYLFIASNNQVNNAIIKVTGKNQLSIDNPKITKSNFSISDSAQVNLSGSFLNLIRK